MRSSASTPPSAAQSAGVVVVVGGCSSVSSTSTKPSDDDFFFHYDRILGEGSFSTVMLATELRTGKRWAVKTLVKKQLVRDKMQDYAYRERNALNLVGARPWDPADLVADSSSTSSSMPMTSALNKCPSIVEEDEEDGVGGATTATSGNHHHHHHLVDVVVPGSASSSSSSPPSSSSSSPHQPQQQRKPRTSSSSVDNDDDDDDDPSLNQQQRQQRQQQRQPSSPVKTTSRKLRHPFFVELHSSFKTDERLFFVLTHAVNGEILTFLKKMGCFPVGVARFYMAEIVSALHHLHKIGIIHRDLKPENILLGSDMHILITDFGSCKILHGNSSTSRNGGQRTSISPTRCVQNPPPKTDTKQGEPRKSSFGDSKSLSLDASATKANSPSKTCSTSAAKARTSSSGHHHHQHNNNNHNNHNHHHRQTPRPRATSFVGTPQYVSPEMLKGRPEEKASDLWALGCILYHFLSGNFPFKGASQYLIFQQIQALDFDFPAGFDPVAKDLVNKLITLDPSSRLGSELCGGFSSLTSHPFFDAIDWETLHLQSPPLQPLLEGDKNQIATSAGERSGFSEEAFARAVMEIETLSSETEEDDFEIVTPKRRKSSGAQRRPSSPNVIPIIAEKRNSGEFGPSPPSNAKSLANYLSPEAMSTAWTATSMVPLIMDLLDLSADDKKSKREKQKRENDYHKFVEGNLILKSGILEKKRRAHYPTRKRMFLLTEGPHLFYVDPDKKELKGQVPWSATMKTKYLNFKKFEIRTPNRTYDLLDPQGGAIDWCQCLDAVRERFYTTSGGGGGGGSAKDV